jgi:hypothetical protein
MDITLVIYSHSTYEDILNVQNDFIKDIPFNKILFTNKEPSSHCFNKIVLYDEKINYTKRVEACLKHIDTKYILFCHDIDVIVKYNHNVINKLYDIIQINNIDRVDLGIVYNNNFEHKIYFDDKHNLIKNTNVSNYIYNVNPSIWKTSVLLNIMNHFDESYRNIEIVAQNYTKQFNIYKISTNQIICAGFNFFISDLFIFIHMTHHLKLLPLNKNNLNIELKNIYKNIRETYKFSREENYEWKF